MQFWYFVTWSKDWETATSHSWMAPKCMVSLNNQNSHIQWGIRERGNEWMNEKRERENGDRQKKKAWKGRDGHVQCAAGVLVADKDNRLSKYLRHRMQTAGIARVFVCKGLRDGDLQRKRVCDHHGPVFYTNKRRNKITIPTLYNSISLLKKNVKNIF